MHLPVRCWQTVPLKCPGVRRPSFQILHESAPISIAFAGGAVIDGVWGLESRVTGVAGVTLIINQLILLVFFCVTRR
jgi:hypothetical protein